MAEEQEYLVRGALLCCRQGSHPRRLNLPVSHGEYICDHPVIMDEDYTDKNISSFGVCYSSTPPEGAPVVRYAGYVPEGSTETAEEVQGRQCIPNIKEKWVCANGQEVHMDSYLTCTCGGIIKPLTSGLEYED